MIRKEYDKAIQYYDRAIEVARLINNKLVLGESLVEKGEALLLSKQMDEAQAIHHEALVIIEALGNPDLIFRAKIFSSKLALEMDEKEMAQQILEKLVKEFTSNYEQADIYYWLFQITQKDVYKKKSLQRYNKLYTETPLFLFEERIKELS